MVQSLLLVRPTIFLCPGTENEEKSLDLAASDSPESYIREIRPGEAAQQLTEPESGVIDLGSFAELIESRPDNEHPSEERSSGAEDVLPSDLLHSVPENDLPWDEGASIAEDVLPSDLLHSMPENELPSEPQQSLAEHVLPSDLLHSVPESEPPQEEPVDLAPELHPLLDARSPLRQGPVDMPPQLSRVHWWWRAVTCG